MPSRDRRDAIGQWIFDSLPSANHTSMLTYTARTYLPVVGPRLTSHREGTCTAVTRQYKLYFSKRFPFSSEDSRGLPSPSKSVYVDSPLFLRGHPLQRNGTNSNEKCSIMYQTRIWNA